MNVKLKVNSNVTLEFGRSSVNAWLDDLDLAGQLRVVIKPSSPRPARRYYRWIRFTLPDGTSYEFLNCQYNHSVLRPTGEMVMFWSPQHVEINCGQ